MAVDLFGNEIVKDELLRDKFIEPPFSILDTNRKLAKKETPLDWKRIKKRSWKRCKSYQYGYRCKRKKHG